MDTIDSPASGRLLPGVGASIYDRLADHYSLHVIAKAAALLRSGHVRVMDAAGRRYRVDGSLRREAGRSPAYTLSLIVDSQGIPRVSCDCPNGKRGEGAWPSCYHSAAVLISWMSWDESDTGSVQ